MKWFKHETDALNSEKLSKLKDRFGMAGYGRWWTLLEIVARRMDETDRCHAEYPPATWAQFLHYQRHDYMFSFLKVVQELGLICAEDEAHLRLSFSSSEPQMIRISIPNLLKKRDNYTKNLQATDKKLASIDVEVDKNIPPLAPPRGEASLFPQTKRNENGNGHKASRIPSDFVLTAEQSAFAKSVGILDPQKEFDHFKDHWIAKAGKDGLKLDWDATLRNWFRNAPNFSRPGIVSKKPGINDQMRPLTEILKERGLK